MAGRLEAIWLKRVRGSPMESVQAAELIEGVGLDGNADQGGWRQVTVIEREVFDRLREELDPELDPTTRRANLMVSGVDLRETRDHVLKIGTTAIRIRGETRPCDLMDEASPGLRDALRIDWSGGSFGIVVEGGEIAVGDEVSIEAP